MQFLQSLKSRADSADSAFAKGPYATFDSASQIIEYMSCVPHASQDVTLFQVPLEYKSRYTGAKCEFGQYDDEDEEWDKIKGAPERYRLFVVEVIKYNNHDHVIALLHDAQHKTVAVYDSNGQQGGSGGYNLEHIKASLRSD